MDIGIQRINEELNEFMREHDLLPSAPPKHRYYQHGDGNMYCWTVEKGEYDECEECSGQGEVVGEWDTETCPACGGNGYVGGWYASFTYRAKGKGARSNKASRWIFDEKTLRKHRKRKDAKARALKLYRKEADER
jgi:hypothetical protein